MHQHDLVAMIVLLCPLLLRLAEEEGFADPAKEGCVESRSESRVETHAKPSTREDMRSGENFALSRESSCVDASQFFRLARFSLCSCR